MTATLGRRPLITFGGVTAAKKTPRTLRVTTRWWKDHSCRAVFIPSVFHESVILTWSMTQCPPLEAVSSAISATVS